MTNLEISVDSSFVKVTDFYFVDSTTLQSVVNFVRENPDWQARTHKSRSSTSISDSHFGSESLTQFSKKTINVASQFFEGKPLTLNSPIGKIPVTLNANSVTIGAPNSIALSFEFVIQSTQPSQWIEGVRQLRQRAARRMAKISVLDSEMEATLGELFNELAVPLGIVGHDERLSGPDDLEYSMFCCLNSVGGGENDAAKLSSVMLTKVAASSLADDDIPSVDSEQQLPYSNRSSFFFSRSGVLFHAHNAPKTEFFQSTMVQHLRGQYFGIFLQVNFQFLTIVETRNRLTDLLAPIKGPKSRASIEELTHQIAQLESDYLSLSSSSKFKSIIYKDHHFRFYEKLQQIFRITDLVSDLESQISQLRESYVASRMFLRDKRDDKTALLVALVTIVLIPLQIILAIFPRQISSIGLLGRASTSFVEVILAVLILFVPLVVLAATRK
jgi:hypothetical protein